MIVGIAMTGSVSLVAGSLFEVIVSSSQHTSVKEGLSAAVPDQHRSMRAASSGHAEKQTSRRASVSCA